MWTLTIEDEQGASTSVDLARDVYSMGRDPESTICLLEKNVSRRHATLRVNSDGGWELVDLESRNGCYLNGHRMRGRALLAPSDLVQIGDYHLRVSDGAATVEGVTFEAPPEARTKPDHLVVAEGPETGRELRLDRGPVTVGGGEGCALQLSDKALRFLVRPVGTGRYEVINVGPRAVLSVNFSPVFRKLLEDGDYIEAPGEVALRFLRGGRPGSARARPQAQASQALPVPRPSRTVPPFARSSGTLPPVSRPPGSLPPGSVVSSSRAPGVLPPLPAPSPRPPGLLPPIPTPLGTPARSTLPPIPTPPGTRGPLTPRPSRPSIPMPPGVRSSRPSLPPIPTPPSTRSSRASLPPGSVPPSLHRSGPLPPFSPRPGSLPPVSPRPGSLPPGSVVSSSLPPGSVVSGSLPPGSLPPDSRLPKSLLPAPPSGALLSTPPSGSFQAASLLGSAPPVLAPPALPPSSSRLLRAAPMLLPPVSERLSVLSSTPPAGSARFSGPPSSGPPSSPRGHSLGGGGLASRPSVNVPNALTTFDGHVKGVSDGQSESMPVPLSLSRLPATQGALVDNAFRYPGTPDMRPIAPPAPEPPRRTPARVALPVTMLLVALGSTPLLVRRFQSASGTPPPPAEGAHALPLSASLSASLSPAIEAPPARPEASGAPAGSASAARRPAPLAPRR
jgi:ABC transport system ATP-binding/permease protein